VPLKSTFPPGTLLAWPSIYTGLLPYRFGLRPEPEKPIVLRFESLRIRNELIGKTFWDIASKNNRKVCIVKMTWKRAALLEAKVILKALKQCYSKL